MYTGYRVDRRRYQRLQVNLSALCRIAGPGRLLYLLDGKEFEALVINLSKSGAALLSPHDLPKETRLFIKVIVFEMDHRGFSEFYEIVTLFAFVKYSQLQYEGRYRVGIEFTDLDEDRQRVLEDIINSSLRYKRMPMSVMPKIII